MVGNSNTRWHWGTAPDAPEPAIPWDAWVFPDGTPVSHTEAAALRQYVSGVDEFFAFEDFLQRHVYDGDQYQLVQAGTMWALPAKSTVITGNRMDPGNSETRAPFQFDSAVSTDILVEASVCGNF